MAEMDVELVAVEHRLWSGTGTFVFARTTEGEIGILPGHESTLAQLVDSGLVRIDTPQGESIFAAVHGGFLSITPDNVTILAEDVPPGIPQPDHDAGLRASLSNLAAHLAGGGA